MVYVYLGIAIVSEVVATSLLKATEGFTRLGPTAIVFVGYGATFYMRTLIVRTMPVGIAIAIWAGLGIVLVAAAGAVFYKQVPDLPAAIGIALIVAGVVIVNVFSKTVGH